MLNVFRFVLGVIVTLALTSGAFASVASEVSLAQQWEGRNNYAKAGYHYDQAARQENNLDKKAKLHQKSLKMYLKTDDFNSVEEAARRMSAVAKNGGQGLFKELTPDYLAAGKRQANGGNTAKAYEYVSGYLAHHPKERNKLADEFNRTGKKELAIMLNPGLLKLECRSLLGQAQKTSNAEEAFGRYSQYVASCAGLPVANSDCQSAFKAAEESLDPLVKLRYYSAGKMIGCTVPEASYDSIVSIIRKFAKTPDERGGKKNENAANLGRTLLPANLVEKEVPILKIPGVGKYSFVLNPGEQLEYWLKGAYGTCTYITPERYNYYILFDSGEMVPASPDVVVRNRQYKYIAIHETAIVNHRVNTECE